MRNVVCTSDAPNAVGPYSQAVKGDGFIFVSGQIPLDPATSRSLRATSANRPNARFRALPPFSRRLDPTWKKSYDAECS
jgi:hypothetical protein